VTLDPWAFIRVGREIGRRRFRFRLLACWAFGAFWIAVGVIRHPVTFWAIGLGVVFLVTPFISLARQRG